MAARSRRDSSRGSVSSTAKIAFTSPVGPSSGTPRSQRIPRLERARRLWASAGLLAGSVTSTGSLRPEMMAKSSGSSRASRSAPNDSVLHESPFTTVTRASGQRDAVEPTSNRSAKTCPAWLTLLPSSRRAVVGSWPPRFTTPGPRGRRATGEMRAAKASVPPALDWHGVGLQHSIARVAHVDRSPPCSRASPKRLNPNVGQSPEPLEVRTEKPVPLISSGKGSLRLILITSL